MARSHAIVERAKAEGWVTRSVQVRVLSGEFWSPLQTASRSVEKQRMWICRTSQKKVRWVGAPRAYLDCAGRAAFRGRVAKSDSLSDGLPNLGEGLSPETPKRRRCYPR